MYFLLEIFQSPLLCSSVLYGGVGLACNVLPELLPAWLVMCDHQVRLASLTRSDKVDQSEVGRV